MTTKTKKTLQHIAAVAVVLLTLCLVFAAPVSADDVHYYVDNKSTGISTTEGTYGNLSATLDAINAAEGTGNYYIHMAAGVYTPVTNGCNYQYYEQREGKNVYLVGSGDSLSVETATIFAGQFFIDGGSRYSSETLKFQNIAFSMNESDLALVSGGNKGSIVFLNGGSGTTDILGDTVSRYAHNILVDSCFFTGSKNAVAIYSLSGSGAKNITIQNSVVDEIHSLFQGPVTDFTVKDSVICSVRGVNVQAGEGFVTITDNLFAVGNKYGIRLGGSDLKLTGITITGNVLYTKDEPSGTDDGLLVFRAIDSSVNPTVDVSDNIFSGEKILFNGMSDGVNFENFAIGPNYWNGVEPTSDLITENILSKAKKYYTEVTIGETPENPTTLAELLSVLDTIKINKESMATSAIITADDLIAAVAEESCAILGTHIELDSALIIDKDFTLDLNGFTLSSSTDTVVVSGTSASLTVQDTSAEKTGKITTSGTKCGAIWVHSGANVTLKSGILNSSANGESVAVYAGSTGETKKHSATSFVMDGGKLEAMDYGLCIYNGTTTINSGEITANLGISGNGNGDGDGTTLIINGGAVIGSTGIYHPQDGKLTINGGTITGDQTGIEMRAGSLTVTGGEITGNGNPEVTNPNDSGTTTDGVGIAVVQHTTQKKIDVAISGGTIKGYTALYQNDTQGNGAEHAKNITISVSGGTFTAINDGTNAVFSAEKRLTITGGTFSSNPSAYIASGYEVVQPGDKYLVQKYVDRSSSSSSSSTPVEPEEPEQPEEPVVEPETPAAPGDVASSTEVTDGGEVAFETTVVDEETGEQSAPAAADDEVKGVVLPTGTEGTVEFVPVSETPAPAGQEENTKRVFEINVPNYEKGKAAVIKFQMTIEELAADGKTAEQVALWHFDEETGEWTKLVTSYTIVDGIVYFEAITNDFSPFAIVYDDASVDEPVDEPVEEPETPASPAPVLGLIAALGAAVVLRRK